METEELQKIAEKGKSIFVRIEYKGKERTIGHLTETDLKLEDLDNFFVAFKEAIKELIDTTNNKGGSKNERRN